MTPEALEEKRQQLQTRFDIVKADKEAHDAKSAELSEELLRLQGEWRAIEGLMTEVHDATTISAVEDTDEKPKEDT